MTRVKLVSISCFIIFIKGFPINFKISHSKQRYSSSFSYEIQMARALIFPVWSLGNSLEITNNKPTFSQYSLFYNYFLFSFFTIACKYSLFQYVFWSFFNHCQRTQSNQEQSSLYCSSSCFIVLLCTHYWPLQCFSTFFRKLNEIGVLRLIFSDYVISCDYLYSEIRKR